MIAIFGKNWKPTHDFVLLKSDGEIWAVSETYEIVGNLSKNFPENTHTDLFYPWFHGRLIIWFQMFCKIPKYNTGLTINPNWMKCVSCQCNVKTRGEHFSTLKFQFTIKYISDKNIIFTCDRVKIKIEWVFVIQDWS